MKGKKFCVYFLGSSGFPYGFANIERQKLISKGLILAGANVTVLNRKGVHREKSKYIIETYGTFEEIDYIYLSGSPYRSRSFIKRNWLKVYSYFQELRTLTKAKKQLQLDAILFNARHFSSILYYYLVSKILNVPVLFNYVELNSAMENRRSISNRINDYLFENIGLRIIPLVLPISDFLKEYTLRKNKNSKCLKIPSLCNFDIFESVQESKGDDYLLFCGSAAYLETIRFIIDSFSLSTNSNYYLYLILNGTKLDFEKISDIINNNPKKDRIKIFSGLSYEQLISYYKSAIALIIPLRPNLRDIARFPHKIGEYTASGRPIISNKIGEVSIYFKDNINAYIASNFDSNEYAEKFDLAIQDPKLSTELGNRGKDIGLEHFDYKKSGQKLFDFLIENTKKV